MLGDPVVDLPVSLSDRLACCVEVWRAPPLIVMGGEQARNLRMRVKLNQMDFWKGLGCTQSAGSRYEQGGPIPDLTLIQMHLRHAPIGAAHAWVGYIRRNRAVSKSDVVDFDGQNTTTGSAIKSLRQSMGLNQMDFWRCLFVQQSRGCRYELGRKVPAQLQSMVRIAYGTEDVAERELLVIRSGTD